LLSCVIPFISSVNVTNLLQEILDGCSNLLQVEKVIEILVRPIQSKTSLSKSIFIPHSIIFTAISLLKLMEKS